MDVEEQEGEEEGQEDSKLPPPPPQAMGEVERAVRAAYHDGVEDEAVEEAEARLEVLLR